MRKTMTISLPAELAKAIDKKAKAQGVSRSKVIQDSFVDQLVEDRFLRAQDRMTKHARSMGIYSDEDVFKKLGLRMA